MITFLIFTIAVIIVCGVLIYCVRMFPLLPAPFPNLVIILIILIGLLVWLSRAWPMIGGGGSGFN